MSVRKRNFWIILTAVGLLFSVYTCMHKYEHKRYGELIYLHQASYNFKANFYDAIPYTPPIDEFVYVDRLPYPTNKYAVLSSVNRHLKTQILRRSCLVYPSEKVIIRVLVDENGHYIRHKVINFTNPLLASLCEQYISDLTFLPAKRDGKTVRYWLNVPFNINMN